MGNSRSASNRSGRGTESAPPAQSPPPPPLPRRDQNNCAVHSEPVDELFSEQFDSFQQKSFPAAARPESVAALMTEKPIKAFTEPVRRLRPIRSALLGARGPKSVCFKSSGADHRLALRASQSAGESAPPQSPESRERLVTAGTVADDERCAHLAAESRDKVDNIASLVEALVNFNKIFKQFPRDYDKLVRRLLHLSCAHCASKVPPVADRPAKPSKAGASLARISAENLVAIQSLLGHLSDHSRAVQSMMVVMSRLEERIETTNQVLHSTGTRPELGEPLPPDQDPLKTAPRRPSRNRFKSSHK